MLRSLRYILPLGLFVVLAVFLWRGLALSPTEVPSPLIGKPAPAFSLARLDDANQTLRRDDLLGKVWILNVWASWCVACREEHPTLMEFARSKSVPVIGLNYKDTRPAGLEWLRRFGDPYDASAFDVDGRVGIDFGVYGVPETFVIDRAGVVRYRQVGPVTAESMERRIVPLLQQLEQEGGHA